MYVLREAIGGNGAGLGGVDVSDLAAKSRERFRLCSGAFPLASLLL